MLTLLLKCFAYEQFMRVTLPSVYINRSFYRSLFSCSKHMMSSNFSTMRLSLVVPACTNMHQIQCTATDVAFTTDTVMSATVASLQMM